MLLIGRVDGSRGLNLFEMRAVDSRWRPRARGKRKIKFKKKYYKIRKPTGTGSSNTHPGATNKKNNNKKQ